MFSRAGQPTSLHRDTIYAGGVREGTMLFDWLLPHFRPLPLLPTNKLCLSGADSGVWACVLFRTPWAPPTDSSMRLGISPATTAPTGFYSQRF